MKNPKNIIAIAVAIIAGSITTSAVTYADPAGGDGTIVHACVGNTGSVRIVADFETCKKNEDPLH